MKKGARFSPCGLYRYLLWREWDGTRAVLVWVMLNPSTADAEHDDATIRKVIGFAKAWGYGSILVLNLFAYRSTKPAGLRTVADPIGPDNDAILLTIAAKGVDVVCAWGANADPARALAVRRYFQRIPLTCLGTTKDGQPRHPLYVPYVTERQKF